MVKPSDHISMVIKSGNAKIVAPPAALESPRR
jgi:hypothetical protein